MNTTNKANILISLNSKTWLSEQLGITRVTLDSRLKNHKWKKLEINKIKTLYN